MTFHAVCAHVMRGAACSPRKRSARRAARAVRIRLVLPFVLLQMVVSLVFPSGAVALSPNDQGVLWGPTSLGGGNSGIVVSATNNFDAALWAIGRWNTKIQLSNDMFAMLSNEGSGGHFYELATYFHSYSEVGSPNWPNAAAVEGYAISLGSDNVWLATVPSGLIADARRDYQTVLDGGSLGGGGGSGDVAFSGTAGLFINSSAGTSSNYWSYGGKRYYMSHILTESQVNNGYEKIESLRYTFALPTSGSNVSRIPEDLSGWNCCVFISRHTSTVARFRALFYKKDLVTVSPISDPYTGFLFPNTFKADVINPSSGKYTVTFDVSGTAAFSPDGVDFTNADNLSVGTYNADGEDGYTPPNMGISLRTNIAGPPAVPPNNNWPTDDPTPTPDPPEVPGPSDDPIPQPDPPDLPDPREYPVSDPYTPDPDPPVNPVVTYDPNPTGEPTDYRPWLNAILVLLRKINTTISDGFGDLRGWLTNHCDHIREQIHSDSLDLGLHIQTAIQNGFVSFERWLQGTFSGYFLDEIDYLLGENFRELEGYLYDLFHWLASQFDFTFGGTNYDDSSVIYWLRRIYARLGGGAPNPGDDGTVDEGFDWWAWLLGLITDALGGIITDFVGDVGGFLATLADVFPFSIPGDIVAYLTLLDAARETPRFVVTIPAVDGWWQSFDYEIDLAPFDDAMAVVRGMYLIYWGLVLAMKTDWLGGVFDFATRAVVQFFDKITGGAYSA